MRSKRSIQCKDCYASVPVRIGMSLKGQAEVTCPVCGRSYGPAELLAITPGVPLIEERETDLAGRPVRRPRGSRLSILEPRDEGAFGDGGDDTGAEGESGVVYRHAGGFAVLELSESTSHSRDLNRERGPAGKWVRGHPVLAVAAGCAAIGLLPVGAYLVGSFAGGFLSEETAKAYAPVVRASAMTAAATMPAIPAVEGAAQSGQTPDGLDPHVAWDETAGERTRITARDPGSVLKTYCSTGAGGERLEPLGVVPSMPPTPTERLGVFRNYDDLSDLWCLRIRRDPETGRWVAGNGRDPLRPDTMSSMPGSAAILASLS